MRKDSSLVKSGVVSVITSAALKFDEVAEVADCWS